MKIFVCYGLILLNCFNFGGERLDIIKENYNNLMYVNVYDNGNRETYNNNSIMFKILVNETQEVLLQSREMPALGVAINGETIEAIKTGVWIEFVFDEVCSYNEMPFEAILFNVQQNVGGVNIIRKMDGEYVGRCFYVDFTSKNMNELYKLINN